MKTLNLFNNAPDFVTIDAERTIFERGHVTDLMYILIDGQVSIVRNAQELVTVGPGSIIGEMAILENRPHFASALILRLMSWRLWQSASTKWILMLKLK